MFGSGAGIPQAASVVHAAAAGTDPKPVVGFIAGTTTTPTTVSTMMVSDWFAL